jgi:perosamine synthetase
MLIPVNEPRFGEKEAEYVSECVRTGWVSSAGNFLTKFEEGWAAYCGRRYGIAVSNGTAALQLAVSCLGLNPGDEIIMPSFTIVSCALAAVYNQLKPVLVDCDPETWCLDAGQIEPKITPRTRVIMPVHIYGHPVDMDPVLNLADKHGLAVVEDAAEAHGAGYLADRGTPAEQWRLCGSFGDLSCFSFYANKLVTTGEGGMVLTDNPKLAEQLRSLRNLCFQPERRFYHEQAGFNFRLTNLQAALGFAQIERMPEIAAQKQRMGREYSRRLKDVGGLQLPVEKPWAHSVYWMYGVVLKPEAKINSEEFAGALAKRGVETRPFFLGMHEQPVFQRMGLFRNEHYPVTENLARRGLYLPSGLALTDKQMEIVVNAVREVLS